MEASWGPLGGPFGPSWGLKLAQVGSKRALGARFFRKSDFSRIRAPLEGEHTLEPQVGPKMGQDRPKIGLRGLQEGLREHLISCQILMSILDHFWVRFGTLLGPLWGPQIDPKIDQILIPEPGCPQDGPKRPQDGPKRPPRGPKRPPRGFERPPRGPQEPPQRPKTS